jgi:Tetrahydrofolate dehydrogenase/cyclohydrolase, NAD(P)-binding domain
VQRKAVVVLGDSNIVGTPLSAMLRDAGAASVTVCHRIAYSSLFQGGAGAAVGTAAAAAQPPSSEAEAAAALRASASACLPQLPGPRGGGAPLRQHIPCGKERDDESHDTPSFGSNERLEDAKGESAQPQSRGRVAVDVGIDEWTAQESIRVEVEVSQSADATTMDVWVRILQGSTPL